MQLDFHPTGTMRLHGLMKRKCEPWPYHTIFRFILTNPQLGASAPQHPTDLHFERTVRKISTNPHKAEICDRLNCRPASHPNIWRDSSPRSWRYEIKQFARKLVDQPATPEGQPTADRRCYQGTIARIAGGTEARISIGGRVLIRLGRTSRSMGKCWKDEGWHRMTWLFLKSNGTTWCNMLILANGFRQVCQGDIALVSTEEIRHSITA